MTNARALVHLVDDNGPTRQQAALLLRQADFAVEQWPSATAFLDAVEDITPGCVVIDLFAPGLDSAAAQRHLAHRDVTLPSVVLTASASRAAAVDAMRGGAIDVLLKPAEPKRLTAAVATGLNRLSKAQRRAATMRRVQSVLALLSPREREVLFALTRGQSNKEIARDLGISARTVEIHRASVMAKLDADSLAQALRIAFIAEVCRMANPGLHVD